MIKKFEFRLEQVLRHRANMEEMKERALAEIEAQLVREQEALAGLLALKQELLDDQALVQQGAIDMIQRDLYQRYLAWISAEQERETRILRELAALRDAKRIELVLASQDRRIVEKLKERERGVYTQEVARADQQALDEVATNAFARGERSWHTSPRSPKE